MEERGEFIQSDSFPKTTALQCRESREILLFPSERTRALKHDIAPPSLFLSSRRRHGRFGVRPIEVSPHDSSLPQSLSPLFSLTERNETKETNRGANENRMQRKEPRRRGSDGKKRAGAQLNPFFVLRSFPWEKGERFRWACPCKMLADSPPIPIPSTE